VLSPDGSCREAVRGFLGWLALNRGETASPNTAAYCKARARLNLHDIEAIHAQVIRNIHRAASEERWYGRRVKVADGSSVSMPDTPANQAIYPQPKGQKCGCGFPVMRLVALFSLGSGLILRLAKAPLNVHESVLFQRLWGLLRRGDVLLADRAFCSFAHIHFLMRRGVDCVMRNHQRRKVGLSTLRRLGRGDRLVQWRKTGVCPKWLTRKEWRAIPNRLTLREITFTPDIAGFRTERVTLVTTLLDPKALPKEAFAQLYRRRWRAEIFLRDIKITLGMDVLRCKTPQRVHKELTMHLIAYNLIRALMLEAATHHGLPPERISFKGTLVTLTHFAPLMAAPHLSPNYRWRLTDILLTYLARDALPNRPDRVEPRARKRRPKNYQLLNQARRTFKEIRHRNHYKKMLS
jgi:hypothetical protein